jgi:hypothetical protein
MYNDHRINQFPAFLFLFLLSLASPTIIMESLVALSLACNVVQSIQFGLHTAHVCKQILEDKSPAANIEEDCKHLRILSGQIQASIASTSNGSHVQQTSSSTITSAADRELLAIAKKLTPIAKDLENELNRCRPVETIRDERKCGWGLNTKSMARRRYMRCMIR